MASWSPKHTPESLLREAATRLQDRILFGSDYPFITPQRWLKDFDALDYFKPEVREKILWRNAQKLLAHTSVGGTKRLDKSAKSWYICSMNRKLWMNPQEAAVSLGISLKTLRRRDKAGKLHVARTAGHHRRIGMAEIQRLQRQGEQAIAVILLEDPDRLVYFGCSSLQETFRWQQVRLEVLDPPAQVDPTTDLLAAVLSIVTVLSGKRYAYRADANPHRKKTLPMLVSKSEQEERAA